MVTWSESIASEPWSLHLTAFVIAIVGGLAAMTLGVVGLGRGSEFREQLVFPLFAGVPVDRIAAAGPTDCHLRWPTPATL